MNDSGRFRLEATIRFWQHQQSSWVKQNRKCRRTGVPAPYINLLTTHRLLTDAVSNRAAHMQSIGQRDSVDDYERKYLHWKPRGRVSRYRLPV